jgi:hypothetical protein
MIWDFAVDRGTGADPVASSTTLAAFTRGRGAYALLLPPAGPTAVNVLAFNARSGRGTATLTWRTASEVEALGFNVWRSSRRHTVKLNPAVVRAKASGHASGASYRLVDRNLRPGTYRYRLQVVGLDGRRSWRGSAVVRVTS